MPIRAEFWKIPLQYVPPLPRDFPQTPYILVINPPYTGERLTAILLLVAEAASRGEACPITVLRVR